MKIKEIMSYNPITAFKSSKVSDVIKLMNDYNIGFIPIIDNENILGVITDRDILIKCFLNKGKLTNTIDKYIINTVISIDSNEEIEQALILFKKHKITRLVVLDNKNLVGIISIYDLFKVMNDEILIDIINCIKEKEVPLIVDGNAKINEYEL